MLTDFVLLMRHSMTNQEIYHLGATFSTIFIGNLCFYWDVYFAPAFNEIFILNVSIMEES